MSSLQTPILGVKHRKEFPGGEEAYLNSIPQNLFLVEMPIDSSISLQSGKYKEITAKLDYSLISARVHGNDVTSGEGVVTCDDCTGEVTRITIKDQEITEEYDLGPCRAEGVFVVGSDFSKNLTFQSTETNLENNLFCPTAAITLEEIIGQLQDNGVKDSFVLEMTIFRTGYASKPFFHDYAVGLNRPKGTGAKVSFKFGSFSYDCEYKSEYNSTNNGFIGRKYCSLDITNEKFNSFKATFSE